MKILSSSFLIILSTLFLIGCNAVTGQATGVSGVSEQDKIDEAVMYIEEKSNACSNNFYSGPMKDYEFKLTAEENEVINWLNDCMADYGTSGNWNVNITYSLFQMFVDNVNLNFSYDKKDIDSTIAYLENLPENSIPDNSKSFSNPNNQTNQDILFANNYLDTATDECIALLKNSMNVNLSPKSDIEAFLEVCSAQKPIFGQWNISKKSALPLGWNIKMTHSPADIQETIIYLSQSGEKQNDEPVLTKSYEVAANEVSNDDNQQQQENSGWDYERQNYTVDEQAALDDCIQEIADAPGWVKVVYPDGTHPMQNYFNSCVSGNGFGNLNFDLNDVEGLFIGASPANALNNEPEENDLTDEQIYNAIASIVTSCEYEMEGLAFPQYMLEDGRTPAQAYFESCLDDEGISVDMYNDWTEIEEPEPVIMDEPIQFEPLSIILSDCVNEAYSSSNVIRFRSANDAEEYLQTQFSDCLNSYNIFEEYSYSEYSSYFLNQTPDDPDNNQEDSDSEESIEDRVNELEQQFADLFEQLQEILESVEN